MTQDEWREVEKELKSLYSMVKLNCDGFEVTLALRRVDQFKNGILVYVNGVFEYKWIFEDCEERRRFCRPIQKSYYSPKLKASLKKLSNKRRKEMGFPDLDKKYTYYFPYWTSFRSLKSHFIKNNQSIELIREGAASDV